MATDSSEFFYELMVSVMVTNIKVFGTFVEVWDIR